MKIIRTDHSLQELDNPGVLLLNLLGRYISNSRVFNHSISVSNAVRENTIIKSAVNPKTISVIPNAIESSKFTADPSKRRPLGTINICYMARIAYRKGKKPL